MSKSASTQTRSRISVGIAEDGLRDSVLDHDSRLGSTAAAVGADRAHSSAAAPSRATLLDVSSFLSFSPLGGWRGGAGTRARRITNASACAGVEVGFGTFDSVDFRSMSEHLFGEEHVRRYLETDGEVGYRWRNDAPILILTTTGRKSGEPRLRAAHLREDDGRYIVVASQGGWPTHRTGT